VKIAVWHNLPSGGGKRALYQHVRGLVERGHDVESWTLSTADQSYLPLGEVAPEHVIPFEDAARAVPSRLQRLLGASEAEERIQRMHAACARCAGEMRERGVDVVFAASCRAFLVPFISLAADVPTVAYIQEPNRGYYEAGHARTSPDVLPWAAEPARPGVVARLGRAVEREALARVAREEWRAVHAAHRVLVNSRFSRESFLRAYGVDSRVCYLGVDTGVFREGGEPRDGFVVGLGSFDAIKGIHLVVRALALLPEPRPALVWIGNSANQEYLAEVERLAASLGVDLRPRIRIPDAEVADLLGRANALVYASRLEPFGFAPLEANACGTPVVAIAEGGVRETVADGVNGYLVEDRDPAALAAALRRLLDDPARARAMGRCGRELVDTRWTVERSVACVERHLSEAAREGRRA
jgi:glycosyltransferase involved in cell wall biosynthesis